MSAPRRNRPVITTEGSVLDLIDELDVERLAKALHEASIDCDYSRKFDRKSCLPGDGVHSLMAVTIAREYKRLGEAES